MLERTNSDEPMTSNNAADAHYHSTYRVEEGVMEEYTEKPPPPPKQKFYKKKKYWIICSIISAIIILVVVLLAVFVFFPMIAQSLMNNAGISVQSAQITFTPPNNLQQSNALALVKRDFNPQTTFYMAMQSKLSNTGPFSASIKFQNPIQVYYNNTLLGNITLPDTSIAGGSGQLDATTPFLIQDPSYFAAFARDMLATKSFSWTMKGKLDITALSRYVYFAIAGISWVSLLTNSPIELLRSILTNPLPLMASMDGFPQVNIKSFQLPSDAAGGGINVELGTALVSPSPIGVQLGTIKMSIGYDGVNLGEVAADGITLKKGENIINLKGVLKPQNNTADLEKIGVLFSNYIAGKISNTTALGVSCAPNGKDPIGWLSEGFQSVQLNVALAASEPLKLINSVSMGYLDLKFNKDAPYAPVASAPAVVAGFSIPFGFSLNITEVSQNIALGTNTTGNFAVINVPMVPAQSNQQAGKLQFAMNNNAITALPGKDQAFNGYTYALTASDLYSFQVGGNATTKTQTPIGPITLSGISFEVPTSLHGLQFLNSTPTIINSLDVTGGTNEALQLSINVTMSNPSDFSISTGDVSFNMLADGQKLGVVTLSNLNLARGANTVMASATFDPKSSPVGQNLLSTFVMGKNNDVQIAGFEGSTAIASLANALSAVSIGSTLPGLKAPLIQGSSLIVNPDTPQTSIAGVQVSIANPFSAGLSITKVVSSVTFQGMPVGNINQDISSNPIVVSGHATAQSPALQMKMNLQPAAVALLLRQLAVKANLNTDALDALLGMGGFHIEGQKEIAPTSDIFQGFNISNYVMEAMKALEVDLQLQSSLNIGQYTDELQFAQSNVKVTTDNSVTRLIPIVGQPIVQQIVDGAKLGFDSIILSAPTDTSFKVQMKGSITNTGPMAASISFPQPLTVAWQGKPIGTVSMPTIQAQANVGAQFDVSGDFTIADQNYMATFSSYLINNNDFIWDIYTNTVDVSALGFTFSNIHMEKFVTLSGANGFKDCVTINSFDLPSNDPAGGIALTAKTTIKNPSQVGFNLNGVGFNTFFKNVLIGPLASDGAAVFPPRGSVEMNMKGRLIHQDSQEGLDAVTQVFDNYLNASNTILTVEGASGSGPNGQVGWLTTAFKTLKIENVILPGPKEKPVLIPSITMKDMEMDFTKDPYAPPSSSKQVEAQLKNPFGFPLGVSQLNMDVTANYNGNNVATLKVPTEKATTSNTGVVTTQFSNIPFQVFDNAHPAFDTFVSLLTAQNSLSFGLAGSANSVADTAVGALKLNNIGFNVQTALAGLNNFDGKNTILTLTVVGGTKDYVVIDLSIQFNNPSQITITIGDISFSTIMNELNQDVGTVYLQNVVVKPGMNQFNCVFHLGGSSDKAIAQMLSDYMTGAKVPLTILGSTQSTKIPSLQKALSTVKLATEMTGIQSNLVAGVKVKTSLIDVLAKKATSYVTLQNPLKTQYAITEVHAIVTFHGKDGPFQMAHIDYKLPSPAVVPVGGKITTDGWPVSVDASLPQLLAVVGTPNKVINLQQNVTTVVGDGFTSNMYYYQDNVPLEIDLDLLGLNVPLGGELPANITDIIKNGGKIPTATPTPSASSSAAPSSQSVTPTSKDNQPSSSETKPQSTQATTHDEPKPTSSGSQSPTGEPSKTTPEPTKESSTKSEAPATTSDSGHHFLWPFKV
ncbi:hypothetical protein EC973_007986 [Apophysomyces ossiformis]|uniref:Uncharacterized protein n=1 Tax=Apophysomyces ossiformis TaxID=679940 RepID=A0A8H7BT70_9FUNG|nr:hypothetical protein EC973_007986 [Apophysomyces ossiformis]